jgi:hypothetical protein
MLCNYYNAIDSLSQLFAEARKFKYEFLKGVSYLFFCRSVFCCSIFLLWYFFGAAGKIIIKKLNGGC